MPSRRTIMMRASKVGVAMAVCLLAVGVPFRNQTSPVGAAPDHCADYYNMEGGRGDPVNQDWFNHLDARGYARLRMACLYHWGGDQYACLDDLWGRLESGWNHGAYNRYSGAYGIPQALPGSKMAMFGADWQTNPRVQVRWGLHYVSGADHNKFHSPCEARTYRIIHGGY